MVYRTNALLNKMEARVRRALTNVYIVQMHGP